MDELIGIVCRQTDYDRETARARLAELDYDPAKVIRAYLGVSEAAPKRAATLNQEIFRQFRVRGEANNREYEAHQERLQVEAAEHQRLKQEREDQIKEEAAAEGVLNLRMQLPRRR